MKNVIFTGKNLSLCLLAALVIAAVFLVPRFAKAQTGTETEQAFRNAGLRLLDKRQDPVDFTLPLLNGGNAVLSSYRGKVVILNFWATWCPPCRAEMPSMETLYQRLKSQGLEILAVDLREDKATVQQFIRNSRFTFPVLLDEDGKTGSKYGISAIPTSFIVDREGKIVSKIVGSIAWDNPKVITAFEALLKGR
ncbi:MAG: TlpA family protein disulfide reductase [Treponema sp.]|nr:TlpA family protein disulfide reductase [Treponema sp.]